MLSRELNDLLTQIGPAYAHGQSSAPLLAADRGDV